MVAVIALLAAIAVPNFLRARKCSTGNPEILEDLRMLDASAGLSASSVVFIPPSILACVPELAATSTSRVDSRVMFAVML